MSFDWLGGVTHWPVKRGDKRREKRERAFIGREKMRGKGRRWFPLAPTAAIMKSPYSPSGAGRAIQALLEHHSNDLWRHIKKVKLRFWGKSMTWKLV